MTRLWITGEALIDFVPIESPRGLAYLPCQGGSTYNVAKAVARQGVEASFIGPISNDLFGDMLADELTREGVDLALAPRIDAPTPLAFVRYDGNDARYAFFDRGSTLVEALYDAELSAIRPGDILHAGSISLILDPGAERLENLILRNRDRAIVSLDPNARPGMVPDVAAWRARMGRLADSAAVLRLSDEDLAAWAPGISVDSFIADRLASGTALVVVTYGAEGAEAATPTGRVHVKTRTDSIADTVGAGDTAMGTILAGIASMGLGTPEAIASLGQSALGGLLSRAMAAAWLNCGQAGCNPPTATEIDAVGDAALSGV